MPMKRRVSSREKGPAQLSDKIIYIIGPRRLQNELMVSFLEQEIGAKCIASQDIRIIPSMDDKKITQPRMILLDCLEKDLHSYLSELESSPENMLHRHLVALFNLSFGLGIEEKALKIGVRGFFYEQDPSLEILSKGLQAMFNGELWASREIMTKSILESRDKDIITKKDATTLTSREIEILTLIATGFKNEQIASQLFISTNTVKTHIYNIFKKIHVPDRLQATLWAAKNL